MSHSFRAVGCLLGLVLTAGEARADLISYSFTGTDTATGKPVTGSFSYQTGALAAETYPTLTSFGDAGGRITVTAGGHTYSSSPVAAFLVRDSLTLSANYPVVASVVSRFLEIRLASASPGTAFADLSTLPGTLDASLLPGSTFSVVDGPAPGSSYGFADTELAYGRITSLESATVASLAPEPGGFVLAALGTAAVAGGAGVGRHRLRRERKVSGKVSGPYSAEGKVSGLYSEEERCEDPIHSNRVLTPSAFQPSKEGRES